MKNVRYQEFAPSPRLAGRVECFWTVRANTAVPSYPVLPDGCVDIIFTRQNGEPVGAEVVGAMTRRRDFALPAGRSVFGVRFHPAMGRGFLRLPLGQFTDCVVPLDALWGPAARSVQQQIAEVLSVGQAMARVEALLGQQLAPRASAFGSPAIESVERAVTWLLTARGQVGVDHLAHSAGLSARQFRRVCLDASGLTPKHLARVVRFRQALARMQSGQAQDWAQLALDCGYYDQAHLINEFRAFAGTTPAEYAAGHPAAPAAIVAAGDRAPCPARPLPLMAVFSNPRSSRHK